MTAIANRLAVAGYRLPAAAPRPAGMYSSAVRHDHLVTTSGQVPLIDGVLSVEGRVGAEVDVSSAAAAASAATLNALAAAATVVDLEKIASCVSARVFIAVSPGFTDLVPVADGGSAVLAAAFPSEPLPARIAVGLCSLPLNAPVEVELTLFCDGGD